VLNLGDNEIRLESVFSNWDKTKKEFEEIGNVFKELKKKK
jgi:hypothetical protein